MEKEKEAASFRKRLAERYRQPMQRDLIVLRGQSGVTVYACRKILLYSPEQIDLSVGKKRVVIRGRGLICSSFAGGAVSVQGMIFGVSFEQVAGKEGGKEPLR